MDANMKMDARTRLRATLNAALAHATGIIDVMRKLNRRRTEDVWRRACEAYARYLNSLGAVVGRATIEIPHTKPWTIVVAGWYRVQGDVRSMMIDVPEAIYVRECDAAIRSRCFGIRVNRYKGECEITGEEMARTCGATPYIGDFGLQLHSNPHPLNLAHVSVVVRSIAKGLSERCMQQTPND